MSTSSARRRGPAPGPASNDSSLEPPATKRPRGRRRAQGRPEQDHAVGRDAILVAARECLKVQAPGALTLKDVAAKAGVDAALVRYYFGNKEGLLAAAVAEMMAERQARSRELLRNDWTPERRLRERLATVLNHQVEEPNFHRLVVEQLFANRDELAHRAVETIAARGLALEVDFLQRSQPALRQVDPRFLNIFMVGLCEFFASSQPLVEAMFGGRPVEQGLVDEYLDFAVDLMLNGLRAR